MAHHPQRIRTRDEGAFRTADKGIPGGGMEVHTTEQLGPNMSRLPNGFLLCKNVPIARSGWLLYGPQEVPVKPGPNGIAYVERTIDALISETTIQSFNAAAVVNDHPPDDVTPQTWKRVSVGFTLNVRRGTGDDADVLLADLMITDKDAIADVLSGKREVSAGYDASYRDLGNGIGRQYNLIGNHIALVKKGRCGPRCAIGDQDYQAKEEDDMTQRVKLHGAKTVRTPLASGKDLDELRERARDAVAALEAAEEGEEEDGGQHIHIHMSGAEGAETRAATGDELDARIDAKLKPMGEKLDKVLEALAAKTKDDDMGDDGAQDNSTIDASNCEEQEDDSDEMKAKKKAFREKAKKAKDEASQEGDSKALETSYVSMLSQAEILAPGFKAPTFDAAISRASTVDRMCNTRRKVLDQFMTADKMAPALLKSLNDGQDVDTVSMTCDAVAIMFKGAAAAKAALNNAPAAASSKTADAATVQVPHGGAQPKSWAEINKASEDYWKPKLVA